MKTSLFFLMLVLIVSAAQGAKKDKERAPSKALQVTKAAGRKKIRNATADDVRTFDAKNKSAGSPTAMAAGVLSQAAS